MENNGVTQPSSPHEHLCVSIVSIFNHLEQDELKEVADSYAEATEASEPSTISSGDIHELFLKYPQISLKIIKEFPLRLDQTEHQVTSFTTEDTETRVALYLIQQAESSQNKEIQLPMSRKDLVSYLGTTPETISRKLTKFEDEGWIQQYDQRAIRIVDMESLSLYK